MLVLELLLLLIIANGAPIAARNLLNDRWDCPIDAGWQMWDGRPLFGASKTVRGLIASLMLTSLCALLLGWPLMLGLVIAMFAMIGDLLSSFIKRRLNVPPSGMALGLDQVPESLLPLLVVKADLGLEMGQVVELTAAFLVLELVLSRILYRLKIRQRPF